MTIQLQRRAFILSLGGAVMALPVAVRAQQPDRPKRIGMLMNLASDDSESNDRLTAFLQELNQLGWIDGRNVRIYVRWGAGDVDSFRRYAAELVALAPDVILAVSTPTLGPLQSATRNAARYFNLINQTGTIEVNKTADLVLLDADPLEDIHNTQKIDAVIMRGRYYSSKELHAMLKPVQ